MAEPVRLGIVGCGFVTERHHLPALKYVRDLRVIGLADVDANRLERLRWAAPGRYANYDDLLNDPEIDAVAVCVPPCLHAEVALAALAKGKHLFIEKPLAVNLADCDRIIEAGKRNPSRKVMAGFNLRWHRLVRQVREIMNRGELGAIKMIRTVFTSAPRSAPWRDAPDSGGSLILDLGVHHFDLVRFLLQDEVEAISVSPPGPAEAVTVTLSMSHGAQAMCALAEGTVPNQEFEVYGDRGRIRVDLYRCDGLERFPHNENPGAMAARLRAAANTLTTLPRALSLRRSGGEFASSYIEQWNQFAQAVLHDKPAEADLFAGRRALKIALAASTRK